MISTYYLDTNVYRRLGREGIATGPSLKKKIALSSISLSELLIQFQQCPDKQHFKGLKQALELARKHGKKRFLAEPTDLLRHLYLGHRMEKEQIQILKKALEVAVRIREFDALGLPVRIGNKFVNLSRLNIGREEVQRAWISAVEWAEANFLEGVDPLLKTRNLATGYYAKLINDWFSSDEWRQAYARGIVQAVSPVSLKPPDLHAAAMALDAAAVFVGAVLRAVIVDGYKFQRNANDAFDHKQLQYLCRKDLIFVTDDNALRFRVRKSTQCSRIVPPEEFLRIE